jgi:hypothetical protein
MAPHAAPGAGLDHVKAYIWVACNLVLFARRKLA